MKDEIKELSDSVFKIANAISDQNASYGHCPSGNGVISSLTEAVMGVTASLMNVSSSNTEIASAIETGFSELSDAILKLAESLTQGK
jgi:hypothetical protein